MASFTLQKAIDTAIQAEELGIKFYSEMAKKFSDNEKLKNVFEVLAKDEVEHKKEFQELLDGNTSAPSEISDEDNLYFKGCDISKYFPSMEEVPKDISSEQVLRNAFQFEKESVLFYSGIKSLLPIHDKIDIIINKERGHMSKLMKYLLDESEFRGLSDKY